MRAPRTLVIALVLCLAALAPPARAHPQQTRTNTVLGNVVTTGAVNVMRGGYYYGLFEFYVHTQGVSLLEADTDQTTPPAVSAAPWIAAMYYPFTSQNNVMIFSEVAAIKVALDPSFGGQVSFPMPGVGTVTLKIKGSTATPDSYPVGFTTPEGHHGHTWNMSGDLVQAKAATVTGSIKKSGVTYDIVPLRIGGQLIAHVAQGARMEITSS